MNTERKSEVSENALAIGQALQNAVTKALDKKKKLGQYAVIWDDKTQTVKRI
ncbi:hypothetical protein [Catenovulum adriaticum]|uniref:Uncharacterized protein n=1 Tax=Catenovulum adriaticum TaxID=2984846 RepID=A0ABY7AM47_9ALTE|nr:hypothetical protein [Catenovulum sp. TS8]WAJ69386.1 hypothetical protein OLW01_09345 [Catenovulum sp. TS8]